MRTVERRRRLIDQKPADLAHVDERRAAMLNAVLPEIRGAEFPLEHDRGAWDQRRAHANHNSIGVVNGQRDQHHVSGIQVRQDEEYKRARHIAILLYDRRLRQTCCARGEYVEKGIGG